MIYVFGVHAVVEVEGRRDQNQSWRSWRDTVVCARHDCLVKSVGSLLYSQHCKDLLTLFSMLWTTFQQWHAWASVFYE